MDKFEFQQCLEIMFQAHTPMKPKEKLSAFYHFFGRLDDATLMNAAADAAQNCEKMPSIKEFSFIISKHTRKKEVAQDSCGFCDPPGVVSARKREKGGWYAFRCHCPAAAKYGYPAWTNEKNRDYERWTGSADDIINNPNKYEKGLNKLDKMGTKMPPKTRARIEKDIAMAREGCPF